jgi:Domain of unknown function (DUF4247)
VLLVCVGAFAQTGCLSASVRDWVADHYEARPSEDGVLVYHAGEPPTQVAKRIADARKPGDRRVTTSGVFLRYRNDMVGVVADSAGGSRILITDERRGYTYFYPYVGGYWGTYSGSGDGFRGGGPGGGK